jgi:hypothetical protein
MKMHIRKVLIPLCLAFAIAGGILVSTGAVAFASTGAPVSISTQKLAVPHLSATSLRAAAKSQTASSSSSCSSQLIPELQWDEYLVAISVSNPSLIFILQTTPHYGQQYDVTVWDSFNGGQTVSLLGTFTPPFPLINMYVYYASGGAPYVYLCGYNVYWISTL